MQFLSSITADFCSSAYQKSYNQHQLICSMSKKGDCYDKAAMKNWNHSFKIEAVHVEHFLTPSEARFQVFEYIEVYYNRKRLHSNWNMSVPKRLKLKKSLSA
jgi:transposase InsO family protein